MPMLNADDDYVTTPQSPPQKQAPKMPILSRRDSLELDSDLNEFWDDRLNSFNFFLIRSIRFGFDSIGTISGKKKEKTVLKTPSVFDDFKSYTPHKKAI